MMPTFFICRKIRALYQDQFGGIAVYATFTFMLLTGSVTMVADYGRMIVLKNQMQNLADSAVMAGAAYLTQESDSIDNATDIINNAISKKTSLSIGNSDLTIQSITFFDSTNQTTTDPLLAQSLSVSVEPESVDLIFYPIIQMLTASSNPNTATITASAAAISTPQACAVPPLMLCDYSETLGEDYDLLSPNNIGKQVKIGNQSGMNRLAPGNFGILDTTDGSQGTQDIAVAMAAVEPSGCYGTGIDTAPGSRADAVRDGINARFDLPAPPHNFADPAPNVINYGQDDNIENDYIGSGDWDPQTYFSEKHTNNSYPTSELGSSPSRYQMYLYELGETFAVNGKKTLYPAPDDLPSGYSEVTSMNSPGVPVYEAESGGSGNGNGNGNGNGGNSNGNGNNSSSCDSDDPSCDGVPEQNTAIEDPRRRVVQAAILNCDSDNVRGNGGPYPTYGRYVELFVTESVGQDKTIYGEIVRKITPQNSEKLKANVQITN